MRVWILEVGEPLPLEQDARLYRYGQFSRALAAKGHEVVWWTSTFSHAPREFVVSGDRDMVVSGVTLRLIHGPGYSGSVSLGRVRHQRHFASQFLRRADSYPKPDLIICPVPTLEGAEAGVSWARKNGVPALVDIRDLWPDEIVDLAPPAFRPAARFMLAPLYAKMKRICAQATSLTGVSDSYLDYALQFAGRARRSGDFVFPLGYSGEPLAQDKLVEARSWRDASPIRPERFTLCFFGTMGNYFSLETVIEAARVLRRELPIQVVLAGTGLNRERYMAIASGMEEVLFPGWLTGPQIAAVMEISKAGLAPYKQGAKMSLPNKPFEYFSGGLPVISSVIGELEKVILENKCGVNYQPESVAQLCSAIRYLHDNEANRAAMGRNALSVLRRRFSTESIFADVSARLEGMAAAGRPAGAADS